MVLTEKYKKTVIQELGFMPDSCPKIYYEILIVLNLIFHSRYPYCFLQ